MALNYSVKEQIRRNAVALISLSVAVTGLAYNTWRNEVSEHNRNQRLVSIQILLMLGDFQQVVLDRRHDRMTDGENARREGWALARTLHDISLIVEGDVAESAEQLLEIWKRDSEDLRSADGSKAATGKAEAAQNAIQQAIDTVRLDTHQVLRDLE